MSAITSLAGQSGWTFHAINRDGTGMLCRTGLKPREFPVYDGIVVADHAPAFRYLSGDSSERASDQSRVRCTTCLNKLAKLTAEAFDEATNEDNLRGFVGRRVRRNCDYAIGTVTGHDGAWLRVLMDATSTHEAAEVQGVLSAFDLTWREDTAAPTPEVPTSRYDGEWDFAERSDAPVEFHGHTVRSTYTGNTYRVLGSGVREGATATVWLQLVTPSGTLCGRPFTVTDLTRLSHFEALCEHNEHLGGCALCGASSEPAPRALDNSNEPYVEQPTTAPESTDRQLGRALGLITQLVSVVAAVPLYQGPGTSGVMARAREFLNEMSQQ
jgi:hypothetical protein